MINDIFLSKRTGKESASAKLNFLLLRQLFLFSQYQTNEEERFSRPDIREREKEREREREREREEKWKKILQRERRKEIKKEKRKKEKNMKCEGKSCAFFNEMEIFVAKFKN